MKSVCIDIQVLYDPSRPARGGWIEISRAARPLVSRFVPSRKGRVD